MSLLVEIDEVFAPYAQSRLLRLQLLPSEIEPLENVELISERTRGFGFKLDAAWPVKPIAFAVVRAKVS
jgi:hypothetical protein